MMRSNPATVNRPSPSKRGYDKQWYKVRAIKLSTNPLCEECTIAGRVTPAEMVHHIKPVDEYPDLRLYMDNLMSLCNDCHAAKHSQVPEYKRLKGCDSNGFPTHPDHPWVRGPQFFG